MTAANLDLQNVDIMLLRPVVFTRVTENCTLVIKKNKRSGVTIHAVHVNKLRRLELVRGLSGAFGVFIIITRYILIGHTI